MKKLFVLLFSLVLAGMVYGTAEAQTTLNVNIKTAKLTWSWVQGTLGPVIEFHMKCGAATGVYTTTKVISDPLARSIPILQVISGAGSYFCAVTAANQFGESGKSNEVNFSAGDIPADPTGLAIVAQ